MSPYIHVSRRVLARLLKTGVLEPSITLLHSEWPKLHSALSFDHSTCNRVKKKFIVGLEIRYSSHKKGVLSKHQGLQTLGGNDVHVQWEMPIIAFLLLWTYFLAQEQF